MPVCVLANKVLKSLIVASLTLPIASACVLPIMVKITLSIPKVTLVMLLPCVDW